MDIWQLENLVKEIKLENTNVIFRAPYHSSFPIVLDEICEDFRLLSMETEEAGNLSLYEYSHPIQNQA